jgi:hypothetical protein
VRIIQRPGEAEEGEEGEGEEQREEKHGSSPRIRGPLQNICRSLCEPTSFLVRNADFLGMPIVTSTFSPIKGPWRKTALPAPTPFPTESEEGRADHRAHAGSEP